MIQLLTQLRRINALISSFRKIQTEIEDKKAQRSQIAQETVKTYKGVEMEFQKIANHIEDVEAFVVTEETV